MVISSPERDWGASSSRMILRISSGNLNRMGDGLPGGSIGSVRPARCRPASLWWEERDVTMVCKEIGDPSPRWRSDTKMIPDIRYSERFQQINTGHVGEPSALGIDTRKAWACHPKEIYNCQLTPI